MSFCFVCTALWRAGGMKAAVCFRQFLSLRINFVFSLSLYSCRLKLYRFRLQLYVFSLKINFSSDAAGFSRSVTSSLPPCLAAALQTPPWISTRIDGLARSPSPLQQSGSRGKSSQERLEPRGNASVRRRKLALTGALLGLQSRLPDRLYEPCSI